MPKKQIETLKNRTFILKLVLELVKCDIEELCHQQDIDSMLMLTHGLYDTQSIGRWAINNFNLIPMILNKLGEDTLPKGVWEYLEKDLAESLVTPMGEIIQSTRWWISNDDIIRRKSEDFKIMEEILES